MSQYQEDELYQQQTDEMIREFLAHLAACKKEQERIDSVKSFIYGVIQSVVGSLEES